MCGVFAALACVGPSPGEGYGKSGWSVYSGLFMTKENLPKLRLFSLSFLLPGLFGMIVAASISTHYMNTLPRFPDGEHMRIVPRNISGYVVYQTQEEARRLDFIEFGSVAMFLVGLVSGLVYLQKWGIVRAIQAEDDEFAPEEG